MSEKSVKWLRLDNSAKIFPMMADKQNQNLFNIFVRLNEDVDKMVLQRALEITIRRFPSMNVMLKRGVFWFYFEEHGGKPTVMPSRMPFAIRPRNRSAPRWTPGARGRNARTTRFCDK